MAVSTAYNTVIAGRVREDEVDFFGKNKVATLSGAWTFTRNSGGSSPLGITKARDIDTEYSGKERPSDGSGKVAETFLPGSNQVG